MNDRRKKDSDEMREAMEIMSRASPVHPSAEVRRRIFEHARAASGETPIPVGRPASRSRSRAANAVVIVLAAIGLAGIGTVVAIDRGLLPLGSTTGTSVSSRRGEPLALRVGAPFPDFAATDVETGTSLSLSGLEGQVVLVNIWATWCPPCETEMPSMERLYRELGPEGFSVVAVSVDQESTSLVRRWVEERGLSFTVLHDRDGRFEQSFRSVGVPESFLIDRDGRLVAREIGPRVWDSPEYGGMVRRLLEPNGA
jgi:peroxiredoxin